MFKAEAKGKKTGEGQNSEGFKSLKVSQMETEALADVVNHATSEKRPSCRDAEGDDSGAAAGWLRPVAADIRWRCHHKPWTRQRAKRLDLT